jgi:hypothetical protein
MFANFIEPLGPRAPFSKRQIEGSYPAGSELAPYAVASWTKKHVAEAYQTFRIDVDDEVRKAQDKVGGVETDRPAPAGQLSVSGVIAPLPNRLIDTRTYLDNLKSLKERGEHAYGMHYAAEMSETLRLTAAVMFLNLLATLYTESWNLSRAT